MEFTLSAKLLKSGMIVSVMTLISRVLGLVRDVVTANVLGAGAMADVFLMVNRIPNFLRRLFAEGAFSAASWAATSSALGPAGWAGAGAGAAASGAASSLEQAARDRPNASAMPQRRARDGLEVVTVMSFP